MHSCTYKGLLGAAPSNTRAARTTDKPKPPQEGRLCNLRSVLGAVQGCTTLRVVLPTGEHTQGSPHTVNDSSQPPQQPHDLAGSDDLSDCGPAPDVCPPDASPALDSWCVHFTMPAHTTAPLNLDPDQPLQLLVRSPLPAPGGPQAAHPPIC